MLLGRLVISLSSDKMQHILDYVNEFLEIIHKKQVHLRVFSEPVFYKKIPPLLT